MKDDVKINSSSVALACTTQIRAIKFVEALPWMELGLLYTCGQFLHLLNLENGHFRTLKVIESVLRRGQAIHGLEVCQESNSLAVYGGKDLRILTLTLKYVGSVWSCDDWILHVQWLEDQTIAILTAHNRVLIFNPATIQVSRVIVCEEQPVLYGGCIHGNAVDNLRIAGGTMWQGVLYWKISDALNDTCKVKRRLKHHGAVFSISFHESQGKILLVSAGEDRCVQLWEPDASYLPILKNDLEVGAWGHTGRVWKTLPFTHHSKLLVLSTAEEALCRLWDFSGDEPICTSILTGHAKNDVWSVAIDARHEWIATGGGAGGLILWNVAKLLQPLPACEVLVQNVVNFHALPDVCLYILSSGDVCINNAVIYNDAQLHSFARVSGCMNDAAVFLVASLSGSLKLILWENGQATWVALDESVNERISDVFIDDVAAFVVTEGGHWCRYKVSVEPLCLELACEWNATESKSSTPSGFTRMHEGYLFSTWQGSLVYIHDDVLIVSASLHVSPIRQVVVLNDNIVTGSRDGIIAHWTLKNTFPTELSLDLVSKNKVTRGSVEGLLVVGKKLYPLCFFGDEFYILDNDKHIFRIECSGKNRKWTCNVSDGRVSFHFTRSKKLFRCVDIARDLEGIQVIPEHHGMRINHLLVVDGTLLSASEDTLIKQSKLQDCQVIPTHNYTQHSSAVRILHQWKDWVLSGGGAGQVFIWKWTNQLVLMGELPHIPQFVRIICLTVSSDFIIVGTSDGWLRWWTLSRDFAGSLQMGTCPNTLQTCTFTLGEYLFAAGTNGVVTAWQLPEFKPVASWNHSSSIDVMSISPQFEIFLGGNDGSVCKLLFDGTFRLDTSKRLHASQVVAIVALNYHVYSLSLDQRVIEWTNQLEASRVHLCTIADVTSLAVLDECMVVGGCGIECFAFTKWGQNS
jgi:WD40 repeat protein